MFNLSEYRPVYVRLLIYGGIALLAIVIGFAPYSPMTRQGIYYVQALVAGLILCFLALRLLGLTKIFYIYAALIWLQTGFVSRLFSPWLRWLSDQELGIYVAALAILAPAILNKHLPKRNALSFPLAKPLLIFLAGGVLAFLTGIAPDREDALYFLRTTVGYSLAIYFVMTKWFKKSREVEQMLMMLSLGGCVMALLAYFGLLQSDVRASSEVQRLGGADVVLTGSLLLSVGPASLSNYLAFLLPLSFGQALNGYKRWQRVVSLVLCAMLVVFLVLSGGRGAWVAGALGCLMVLVLTFGYQLKGASHLLRPLVALAVLGLLLNLVFSFELVPLTPEVRYRIMSLSAATTEPSWIGRLLRWQVGMDLIAEHPLGTGFVFLLPGTGFNPHSLYIGLVLGVGIVGLSGLVWFMAIWFRRCIAALRIGDQSYRSACIGAMGSVIAALVAGFGHDLNLITWNFAALWLVFSATIAATRSVSQRSLQGAHALSSPISLSSQR